jgi:hypothetical protein
MGVVRTTLKAILTTVEDYFLLIDKLLAMMVTNSASDRGLAVWTEKPVALLKVELASEAYEAAWQYGIQLSLDQAVALVLERLN